MTPSFHPSLVNGRFGDPALFVEILHQRGALLFDVGDLTALSARDLLRISHVFISHTHVDHFIGFDALLRLCVGRDKRIEMVGPTGFIERLGHKLQAYEWDLVDRYETDLIFDVTEVVTASSARRGRYRFKQAFALEDLAEIELVDQVVARQSAWEVRAEILDHHGPCLGFSLAEQAHANVWKSRLQQRGLPTGQWLAGLKRAVLEGLPGDHPVALPDGGTAPLDDLRDVVVITRGQKLAYVTDVADTSPNRATIEKLAREADALFIEARFAAADAARARQRAHLTTTAAGEIARTAGARKVEPFHFSPRYEGEEARMLGEVAAAFQR